MPTATDKTNYRKNVEEIDKTYEALRKKYKLPKFSELQEEFDIKYSELEADQLMLPTLVLGLMHSRISGGSRDISMLLTAGAFCCMHEIKSFSTKERERAWNLYQEHNKLIWSIKKALISGPAASAKEIDKCYNDFKKIKPEIVWFYDKMYNAWANFKEPLNQPRYVK